MAIDRWPEAERPRERLYWNGPEALADAELLAIQLGSGTRGKSAIEGAREVVAAYGSLGGVAARARVLLSGPAEVYAAFAPLMEDLKREVFRIALLDAQNGLLRDRVISEGTLSASLVHPREVFKPAILESAASVILIHNHPSGDPTPSREDVRLLDLRIHDHLVIGPGRFVSLAEAGVV